MSFFVIKKSNIYWIPSLVDIKENDKVDLLAKNACKNKMIQVQVSIYK